MEKVRGFEIAKGFEDKAINLPKRKTKCSAGYDVEAAEDTIIPSFKPGVKPTLVKTGIKSYFPDDEYLMLANRSSNPGKKGLVLANSIGVGYHTVHSIIKEYLSFLREDLLDGNSIDIRGIVSLHPLLRDGKVVKVHSSISTSIKRDLSLQNRDVSSVRAHTHKLLKHSIKMSSDFGQEVLVE